MSRVVEQQGTIMAPGKAVSAFLRDIGNWPMIWFSPLCPGPFHWEGDPWRTGSYIVGAGRVFGFAFRQEVEATTPGNVYRVSQRAAGMAYTMSCRISDVRADECTVKFTTTVRGWASAFAPQSQLEAAPQFSMPALKTESELSWLRGARSEEPAPSAAPSEIIARPAQAVAPRTTLVAASASEGDSDNPLAAMQVVVVAILVMALVVIAVSVLVFLVAMRTFMHLQ